MHTCYAQTSSNGSEIPVLYHFCDTYVNTYVIDNALQNITTDVYSLFLVWYPWKKIAYTYFDI